MRINSIVIDNEIVIILPFLVLREFFVVLLSWVSLLFERFSLLFQGF